MAEQIISHLSSPLSLGRVAANPAPAGLFALGLTTLLVSLHCSGILPVGLKLLAVGFLYGGLGQTLAGIASWKKGNAFGATAFTSLGLFWLSLLAMMALPEAGWGHAPQVSSMASYLVMWGLFSTILFKGAFELSRAHGAVFALLAALLVLLAAGDAAGSSTLKALAGWTGVACAAAAIYTGLAQILNEALGRTVAPLGGSRR